VAYRRVPEIPYDRSLKGGCSLRRDPLSHNRRSDKQHDLSLPHLPARRSVAGGRVGHLPGHAIRAAQGRPAGVPFVAAGAPNLLRGVSARR
jgi:hypothetical protein